MGDENRHSQGRRFFLYLKYLLLAGSLLANLLFCDLIISEKFGGKTSESIFFFTLPPKRIR